MTLYVSRRTAFALTAMLLSSRSFAAAPPLKIATIGAGNIGSTLGGVWAKAGHPVMLSSRHPADLKDAIAKIGPNAKAGTVAEAVAFGDVILLAVPYGAMPAIAKEHGKALAAKALIFDATNPFVDRDGAIAVEALILGAGLHTAKLLPGAHIVRAFNAIGAARFGEGGRMATGVRIGIPIASDDGNALGLAGDLIRETGFEPVPIGGLAEGKYLIPGSALAGEHAPREIRRIAATMGR